MNWILTSALRSLPILTIAFNLAFHARVAGAGEPPKVLKGFSKVFIPAGACLRAVLFSVVLLLLFATYRWLRHSVRACPRVLRI